MRKLLRVGLLLMAVSGLLVFLAGCGSSKSSNESSGGSASSETSETSESSESSESSEASGGSEEAKTIKVGLGVIGPVNDKAFSQEHHEGILAAVKDTANKAAKIELSGVIQNTETPQQQEDAFKTLASSGDEVVVLASAQYAPVTDELADQYPNVLFIQTSAFPEHEHKNVVAIVHNQGPVSMVAGAVQEKLTKAKTLGYVGSLKIPSDVNGQVGYTAGAKLVNPNVKVLVGRTGNFNDIAKAKSVASSELSEGAEGLYGFVDSGIIGLYKAASESPAKPTVTNIAYKGCEDQPYPNVVGPTESNYKNMIEAALDKYAEGSLETGGVLVGLKTPEFFNFWLCKKYQNKELTAYWHKVTEEIVSGKIEVPKAALEGMSPGYKVREEL